MEEKIKMIILSILSGTQYNTLVIYCYKYFRILYVKYSKAAEIMSIIFGSRKFNPKNNSQMQI